MYVLLIINVRLRSASIDSLFCKVWYSSMFVYPLISFFFFSSRRRHTRFDCDWSSDVCSSDLTTTRVIRSALISARPPCRDQAPHFTAEGVHHEEHLAAGHADNLSSLLGVLSSLDRKSVV